MPAPELDESQPVFGGGPVDDAMDQLRDNVTWIIAMLAAQVFNIPPWAATPSGADLDKPDYVELVHSDGRKIKATYSYTGDDVTGMVIAFNSGAGYANFINGTATITFNGSGQWTGTTWA